MRIIDARSEGEAQVTREAARVVRSGGTLIFPTDTVYGIGCDPADLGAVDRIFRLKGRPRSKPLSLHLAGAEALLEFAPENEAAIVAAGRFLPGPLTIIVRRPSWVHESVTAGLPALGLRVPDHALCRAILAASGPLAGTSANLSGRPAYAGAGRTESLPEADLMVDDGPTRFKAESTVVDVSGSKPRLVRAGVITVEELEACLGPLEVPVAPEAEGR